MTDPAGGETMPPEPATTHADRPNRVQCHMPAHEGFPGPRPGVHPASAR